MTADVAVRARIVLWVGEGRRRKDIAELAGVSARTVDRTRVRYEEHGVAGLVERKRGGTSPPESGAHAGRSSEAARGYQGLLLLCRPYLAGGKPAAAPVGQLQTVERPGVRGAGRRYRRVVPGPARGRCRPVHRREDAGARTCSPH
ncbi:helix-turn-helix domain-containing protein [Streptomyces sp. NPDC047042]|uniref:helix-turn-helix domain-containing protein n=1 Tax=Streptomyces sp. NPDC047042 TaxID=3154807 RepID=UPI0033FE792F